MAHYIVICRREDGEYPIEIPAETELYVWYGENQRTVTEFQAGWIRDELTRNRTDRESIARVGEVHFAEGRAPESYSNLELLGAAPVIVGLYDESAGGYIFTRWAAGLSMSLLIFLRAHIGEVDLICID